MRRGATSLHGRGMYTQAEREVIMVALTVTELAHLKAIVSEVDSAAFAVVVPAQEILGRDLRPLEPQD